MWLTELEKYTGQLLAVDRYRDYCPNGLQVEGRSQVRKLVTGVTASLALLEAALVEGADAVLVHHGYFWRNEDSRIIGVKRNRLAFLLRHEISLLAYHLPLDAHPSLGNNAQLATRLGLAVTGWFGEQHIATHGTLSHSTTLDAFVARIGVMTQQQPLVIAGDSREVRRVAWCSGGAQGYFEAAIQLGVDVFLTGEISEANVHLARETGVAFISAGHHATERYGVQALGEHLARHFGLDHCYMEVPNPI